MKKLKLFILASLMIGAVAVASGCNQNDVLDAPTNIEYNVENELTWAQVEGAKSYLVEIVNVATGETHSVAAKKTSPKVSLSFLAQGDYDIRVKALARDEDENGEWSETVHFERGYETGCVYTLVNDGKEYQITKFGTAASTIYIEDVYRGKPVTGIASRAFKGYPEIEYVYVGNNVEKIGDNAFYNCKNLKGVYFDKESSLRSIGVGAFQSCGLLEEINIPQGVTALNDSVFAYCRSLKEIVLHDNILTLGSYAFSDCSALTSVTIPDSVTTLGASVFTGCSGLQTVTIGANVATISNSAFYKCSALTAVTFSNEGNLKKIDSNAFRDCNALTSIVIPEGVEDIASYAFTSQIEVAVTPEGQENINVASVLENVELPASVTHIGINAFFGTKLYMEQYLGGKDVYVGDWLVMLSLSSQAEALALEQEYFKDTICGIADSAVSNCAVLEEVYLPQSVKYIGNSAFRGNKKLYIFEAMENSVESIGDYAFMECKILSSVVFGNGVKTIGEGAFMLCERLDNAEDNVIVPDSVTMIEKYAFKGTKLEASPDEFGLIYADNWIIGYQGNITSAEISKDAVGIAEYAFANSQSLQSVLVPNNSKLKKICRGAFYNCARLDMPDFSGSRVQEIEEYAFYKCESLSKIKLPIGLVTIGKGAFGYCEQLTEIDLSGNYLQEVGERAFYNCINLKTVKFGKALTTIGKGAFYKCIKLEQVALPNSVTTLGTYAFGDCEALKNITLSDKLTEISDYAFVRCTKLEEVTCLGDLKAIGDFAFFGCTNLTAVHFNEGLETIGDHTFSGAVNLVSAALPSTLQHIGTQAFRNCASMTAVTLGKDVSEVGEHAFYGCTAATIYVETGVELHDWAATWNSTFRPIVWDCVFAEDGNYVASVTVMENTLQNAWNEGGFGAPEKAGYQFAGWATSPNGETVYKASEMVSIPMGTTLYAVWVEA